MDDWAYQYYLLCMLGVSSEFQLISFNNYHFTYVILLENSIIPTLS